MLTVTKQGHLHPTPHPVQRSNKRPREEEAGDRTEPRPPTQWRARRPSADHCRTAPLAPTRGIRGELSFGRENMETYHGHVRTPADAIILFEACRLGLLPRVQRRLSEKERQSIKSGSVFVWDEREAGMRRWTDGKSWSASRVSGSFLTYREMEGKRGGSGFAPPVSARSRAGKSPTSVKGSDSDVDMGDDGPDGYRYKPDGLMKQSFSITTSTGQHLHLISYFSRSHPNAPSLAQPTNDPNLRHIRPQKGMYPESTVHEQQNVPVVTRGPVPGGAQYPTSSHHALPPMSGPPGYARSGATHPHSYVAHQPYGWPQSAVGVPPPNYPVAAYGGQLGPPSAGNASVSPSPYSQTLPPTSAAPGHYDRSPAPPQESGLPPPPPSLNQRASGSPNGYVPSQSPRVAHAASPGQQVAEQGAPSPASMPSISASKIDPRLTAMSAPTVVSQERSGSHTPPTSLRKLDNPDAYGGGGLRESGPSATSIPSIGSLMNGSAADAPGDAASEHGGSRAGSRSPGGTAVRKGKGPHDIPGEKMGFGEDVRALRVLDRAFSA
ncbi:MAG: hypothetical protein M1832_005934 [Thelocarpon impressellum]|nr:MAG: hypothetical protein M1832_005934 [Thelocarpon impressellum]